MLGDFPAAVVAMAKKPGVEKSRHSMATPKRLTRVSTKMRSWGKKEKIHSLIKKQEILLFIQLTFTAAVACAHCFILFLLDFTVVKTHVCLPYFSSLHLQKEFWCTAPHSIC